MKGYSYGGPYFELSAVFNRQMQEHLGGVRLPRVSTDEFRQLARKQANTGG